MLVAAAWLGNLGALIAWLNNRQLRRELAAEREAVACEQRRAEVLIGAYEALSVRDFAESRRILKDDDPEPGRRALERRRPAGAVSYATLKPLS